VRRLLVLGALLGVLSVAGCAGRGTPAASSTESAVGAGSRVFAGLSLPATVDGARFDPAGVRDRPVVLWFWAPWCTVCRGEGPTVAKVAAEYAGKVSFVGVGGQGTTGAMSEFVQQTGTGRFPHLADVNGGLWRDYGVSAQPAFAFVTREGRADLRVGSMDEASLSARVAELASGATTSTVTPTPGRTCSSGPNGRLDCGSQGPPHPSTMVPTTTP
jgi:thiol-disulfide isomerase/thioredoxin